MAQVVDAAVQTDVLADGEVFVERKPLAHVADVPLDRLAFARDVVAGDGRGTAGWREQSDEHPDRRRFAGAVRAEKTKDLACAHVEGDVIDGGERSERAREAFRFDGEFAIHDLLRSERGSGAPPCAP